MADPCAGWGFTRESSVPCLNAHRFSPAYDMSVAQLAKQQLLPMSTAVRSLQDIYFRSLSTHCNMATQSSHNATRDVMFSEPYRTLWHYIIPQFTEDERR